jgi:hypothetical protein
MPLILKSLFDKNYEYTLDPETGGLTVERAAEPDRPIPGLCGFADVRFVGLRLREPTFTAVYTDGRDALFQLGSDTYNIGDSDIAFIRRGIAPFAKSFKILRAGKAIVELRYWWADVHAWPDDDVLDIFLYVPSHVAGDPKRFVSFWSQIRDGKTPTEVARSSPQLART